MTAADDTRDARFLADAVGATVILVEWSDEATEVANAATLAISYLKELEVLLAARRLEALRELRAAGLSLAAIGAAAGLTRGRVAQLLAAD